MTEEENAQILMEFKRKVEIIIAKAIRVIMGVPDDYVIHDSDTFYNMSADIMRLGESDLLNINIKKDE